MCTLLLSATFSAIHILEDTAKVLLNWGGKNDLFLVRWGIELMDPGAEEGGERGRTPLDCKMTSLGTSDLAVSFGNAQYWGSSVFYT